MLERLHGAHVFTGSRACFIGVGDDMAPLRDVDLAKGFVGGGKLVEDGAYECITGSRRINRYDRYAGDDLRFVVVAKERSFLAKGDCEDGPGLGHQDLDRIGERRLAGDQHGFFIAQLEKMTGVQEIPGVIDEFTGVVTKQEVAVVGIEADKDVLADGFLKPAREPAGMA